MENDIFSDIFKQIQKIFKDILNSLFIFIIKHKHEKFRKYPRIEYYLIFFKENEYYLIKINNEDEKSIIKLWIM